MQLRRWVRTSVLTLQKKLHISLYLYKPVYVPHSCIWHLLVTLNLLYVTWYSSTAPLQRTVQC